MFKWLFGKKVEEPKVTEEEYREMCEIIRVIRGMSASEFTLEEVALFGAWQTRIFRWENLNYYDFLKSIKNRLAKAARHDGN